MVVVTVDAPELAHSVASAGAAVVIVASTTDARDRAGRLARAIEDGGGRAAVFADDPATDAGRAALTEMLDELFDR